MTSISLAIPVPSHSGKAALAGLLRGMGVAVGNGTPRMGSAALEQTTGADRYQIVRRISAGGMAEVHLARLDSLEGFKRLVALKRLLPKQMEREPIREMFLREARLCGLFQHPNLVSVADVGCDGEGHFFAMDYVRGRTLRELLMQAEWLTTRVVSQVILEEPPNSTGI